MPHSDWTWHLAERNVQLTDLSKHPGYHHVPGLGLRILQEIVNHDRQPLGLLNVLFTSEEVVPHDPSLSSRAQRRGRA
jgi:hypothetical protein